jgi:hypothetical protein
MPMSATPRARVALSLLILKSSMFLIAEKRHVLIRAALKTAQQQTAW